MEKQELRLVCMGLAFAAVFLTILQNAMRKKKRIENYTDFLKEIYENGKENGFYEKKKRWLTECGAAFHFGSWMNPYTYYLLRVILGAVGYYLGSVFGVMQAVFCALFFSFLPTVCIVFLNKQDNTNMLGDLKLMYHSLEIQIRAGVHITDAMAEVYGCVQQKRLRHALLNLSGELVLEGNIYLALEHFREQFRNEQIDILCVILLQALETGQAVELIREMEGQLKDLESMVRLRKKQNLDRSITFYQLGILACMLAVVLYSCISGMFGAAWFL